MTWWRQTVRWGQTNLTELDPTRYDAKLWIDQWRRTHIQGVIVNAGGIVAYYPSAFEVQHRASDRDLYGEIVAAARAEGLAAVARMDSNRTDERCYVEHPDWFAYDASGEPYRAGDLYVTCVNSPYYKEFLPAVLTEIIERSQPDGFADNSWSGLGRDQICYCTHCARGFGERLPARVDWDDPIYRAWVKWSYQCRLDVWDLNNVTTKRAGGPDCLWIGMIGGQIEEQAGRLRDIKAIAERSQIIFLDSQTRPRERGFHANSVSGKLLHDLVGWETLIPESTAMYGSGRPTFRLASQPAAEARMWAVEGFAGGIQPWWHHIGAFHEDRRQYSTAPPLFGWHASHEEQLLRREPVATVGVVWSQDNAVWYGRDAAESRAAAPYWGVIEALIRHRIPYVLVHADHIETCDLSCLVLPNVGYLTDPQCAALRAFVDGGGGLVVTGETSSYGEAGWLGDFAIADLLGVHATGRHHGSSTPVAADWSNWDRHTYLRLDADCGFEDTSLLPFGGRLDMVTVADAEVVATFVPAFPIYPPEKSWMATPRTSVPAVTVRSTEGGSRIAYLAADLDRCYHCDKHPDHAQLIAHLVRWTAHDDIPLAVDGAGRLDCHLYRQGDARILHLVNLTGATHPGPLDEVAPTGPFTVRIRAASAQKAELLVAGAAATVTTDGEWARVDIPSIAEHEVVVLR